MRIAICDDERIISEEVRKKTESCFNGEAETVLFENPHDLLDLSKEECKFDILITDIDLKTDMDGIGLAKAVNKKLPDCKVIFLTGYYEYVSAVYETEHTYFVIKTQMEKELPNALKKAVSNLNAEKRFLFVENKVEKALVDVNSVKYIERLGRKSRLVCENGEYYTAERLPQILKRLPRWQFSQCHTSFIVNFKFAAVYRNPVIIMKDNNEIPVSRKFKKQVDFDMMKYVELFSAETFADDKEKKEKGGKRA